MPYFRKIKILFIHIPRTGGTTVECYFYQKDQSVRSTRSLFSKTGYLNGHSLQHCTYQELRSIRKRFNIHFPPPDKQLTILTIVRNPYDRLFSDLIAGNSDLSPEMIDQTVDAFIHSENTDSHQRPQVEFLIDNNGAIPKNIIIMHTESLNDDMIKLGYNDFAQTHRENVTSNASDREKLISLLSQKSIDLINLTYKRDFEMFGYTMKSHS
jgi:hypothetical protein